MDECGTTDTGADDTGTSDDYTDYSSDDASLDTGTDVDVCGSDDVVDERLEPEDDGCGPDSSDSSDSSVPDVPLVETSSVDGSGCGTTPEADPSLGSLETDEPATTEPAATSTVATPAAAAAGTPVLTLPESLQANVVTPGTLTPVSWDAAGNPTHVSYSGIINPPTTTVQVGGTPLAGDRGITDPTYWQLRELTNQTQSDMITNTLTGVSVDRTGSSPTYYGNGKPFDNFGDALGAERHGD